MDVQRLQTHQKLQLTQTTHVRTYVPVRTLYPYVLRTYVPTSTYVLVVCNVLPVCMSNDALVVALRAHTSPT